MRLFGILSFSSIIFSISCKDSDKPTERIFSGDNFTANIRTTTARTPEDERLGFRLPDGFEITLFASEPQIGKPINIAFDAKGRLWVTQSFEYPFPANPGNGKDRLTILEDKDHDGRADSFTNISDTLNIPIGVLPSTDGAYVYSIPNIYHLASAANSDAPATSKKLFGPFRINDTHGMLNNFVRGYDGWIHSCHGFTNRDTVAGKDGEAITLTSGSTFRFRPDGSRIEKTTDGRINPFGLAYDEKGYLYSSDCHTSPLYQLISGGDYSQWGKEEGMGFAPNMQSLTDEATALAGVAYYSDNLFPENFLSNFFIGDPVRSRVYRYSFNFKGSTPIGKKEEDFILSEDPWFRPVDVKLGPDGALYIADFYNSIIGHYEVPLDHPARDRVRGRIWKITYKGKQNSFQDLSVADVDQLLKALSDKSMVVRMAAADQLSDRIGSKAVSKLVEITRQPEIEPLLLSHALWILHRIGSLSDAELPAFIKHKDPLVRLHAMRIAHEMKPSSQLLSSAVNALADGDPHVKRAAVEVISKYPDTSSLRTLLEVRDNIPEYESHLLYTTRLALREMLKNDSLLKMTSGLSWSEKQAGYIADVLIGVQSQSAGDFLVKYVNQFTPSEAAAPNIFRHIVRFGTKKNIDPAIEIALAGKRPDTTNLRIFEGLQQGLTQRGLTETKRLKQWGQSLAIDVLKKHPFKKESPKSTINLQKFAVTVVGLNKMKESLSYLDEMVKGTSKNDFIARKNEMSHELLQLKLSVVRAMLRIDPRHGSVVVARALNNQDGEPLFSNAIGNILGEFPPQLATNILKNVKNVSPELQMNIAMTLSGSPEGKNLLLAQAEKGEISAKMLVQPRVHDRFLADASGSQLKRFEKLTANIEPVDKEKQDTIYARLLEFDKAQTAKTPSVDKGKIVFQKRCSPCHSVAGEGGAIGPNLDGVGQWGARALAEKIFDPNRNVSESFKTYIVKTKDGKEVSGLLRRNAGEAVVFADLSGKEFSVPKKEIVSQTASAFTLMPDNFLQQLSQEDFNSLVVFLMRPK